MSLCQPENAEFSCGACCGFLNLKLLTQENKILLKERTRIFAETVNLDKNHSIATYRQISEKKEESIQKKDVTTYNCPFLGYLDSNFEKIGCMIHPSRTNNPKSQNFSFYGTSICQSYECKNKESKNAELWERILSEMKLNSIEYSKIASDHISLGMIENFLLLICHDENYYRHSKLIEEIFRYKLDPEINPDLQNPTSFEINYSTSENEILNTLCERINIVKTSKLYQNLQYALEVSVKSNNEVISL